MKLEFKNIKEIAVLAQQKGFKGTVLSTNWTMRHYNGVKGLPLVTNMCEYLLLCDIQFWLRNNYFILLEISIQKPITNKKYYSALFSGRVRNYNLNETINYFKSYELCLEYNILKVLKVLPDNPIKEFIDVLNLELNK